MRVTRGPGVASGSFAVESTRPAAGAAESAPSLWWKRAIDLGIGVPLLLVLLPIIGLLALLTRLDSTGPAFFRQERVGRNGARFRMWKLRSMYTDAPHDRHQQAVQDWFAGNAVDGRYKTLADPRITRVGRWTRRLNLDELPQLFNVVRGEMSLVGPRPAIPYELDLYDSAYLERLRTPPGITGLWQVTRRELVSAPEMMALDLRYVREASPWLDLKTIVLTVPALVRGALGKN